MSAAPFTNGGAACLQRGEVAMGVNAGSHALRGLIGKSHCRQSASERLSLKSSGGTSTSNPTSGRRRLGAAVDIEEIGLSLIASGFGRIATKEYHEGKPVARRLP
jgi:hypothetical protein